MAELDLDSQTGDVGEAGHQPQPLGPIGEDVSKEGRTELLKFAGSKQGKGFSSKATVFYDPDYPPTDNTQLGRMLEGSVGVELWGLAAGLKGLADDGVAMICGHAIKACPQYNGLPGLTDEALRAIGGANGGIEAFMERNSARYSEDEAGAAAKMEDTEALQEWKAVLEVAQAKRLTLIFGGCCIGMNKEGRRWLVKANQLVSNGLVLAANCETTGMLFSKSALEAEHGQSISERFGLALCDAKGDLAVGPPQLESTFPLKNWTIQEVHEDSLTKWLAEYKDEIIELQAMKVDEYQKKTEGKMGTWPHYRDPDTVWGQPCRLEDYDLAEWITAVFKEDRREGRQICLKEAWEAAGNDPELLPEALGDFVAMAAGRVPPATHVWAATPSLKRFHDVVFFEGVKYEEGSEDALVDVACLCGWQEHKLPRCGDSGGKNKKGLPCRNLTRKGERCHWHK